MNDQQERAYNYSIQRLKQHKIRITPQRQIVLKYLITHHNHPSINTIHKTLRKQFSNLSMATIYNVLRTFDQIGLTISLPGKNDRTRFDFYGKPHFHAICKRCGRIFDVFTHDYPKLDRTLANLAKEQAGFTFSGSKVEIFGLCPRCQKELANQK